MTWDGIKRRAIDFVEPLSDHDKIIRMIEIQSNQITILEDHKRDFKEHKDEDDKNFKSINRTISFATGAIMVVIFVAKIIFR